MKLAIIIINWNTCDLLAQCLNSIYVNQPSWPFEVWVVDNGSIDGSVEMTRQRFPDVHLIENQKNLGFARANNQGLRAAQGCDCLLLNSDTIVQSGSLEGIIQCANTFPEAGVIGCKLLNPDGTLQKSWAKFPMLWSEIMGIQVRERRLVNDHPLTYDVDWVGGACFYVRCQAMNDVGLLDETLFMYSEEVDWCYRLKQHGWKVYYLADATIIHLGGGSESRVSAIQLIRLHESKIYFFSKYRSSQMTTWLQIGLLITKTFGFLQQLLTWPFHFRESDEVRLRLSARWQLIRWLCSHSPELNGSNNSDGIGK